jgi:hypothetical protein
MISFIFGQKVVKCSWLIGIFCAFEAGSLSSQPARNEPTGLVFASPSVYETLPIASTPLMGDALPQRVDLSKDFPAVGDQGTQASCVGWALSYLKGFQEQQEQSHTPPRSFSPAFIYNQTKLSGSCNSGTTYDRGLSVVRFRGAALWSDFEYVPTSCNSLPNANVMKAANPYKVESYQRVNPKDQLALRGYIASGLPILIGMEVDDAFRALRRGEVYSLPNGIRKSGHAMVVTGYDESRKAYKVINSWGTAWADDGFGWVAYDAFSATVREAYIVFDGSPVLGGTVESPLTSTPELRLGPADVTEADSGWTVTLPGSSLVNADGASVRIAVFSISSTALSDSSESAASSREYLLGTTSIADVSSPTLDLARYSVVIPRECTLCIELIQSKMSTLRIVVFVNGYPLGETTSLTAIPITRR